MRLYPRLLSVFILEAITRLHNQGLSQNTDMDYFYFRSKKGFVGNNRINSIGRSEKLVCIRIAKSVR